MAESLAVRDGQGMFRRGLKGAERDAEAARMKAAGYLHREIAQHLGYANKGTVTKAIARALKDVQAPAVAELRASQQTVIDTMKSAALDILARQHVAHSNGRVVYDLEGQAGPDGKLHPVFDDGPRLAAIGQLRQVLEREAKLWGTDSPIRTVVEGDELVIRIKGVDTDAV